MIYEEKIPHFIHAFQYQVDTDEVGVKGILEYYPPSQLQGTCKKCGQSLHNHGIINNTVICPGDFIIYEKKEIVNIIKPKDFNRIYRRISYEDYQEGSSSTSEETTQSKEGQEVRGTESTRKGAESSSEV